MDYIDSLINSKIERTNVLCKMIATIEVVMENNDLDEWSQERLADVIEEANFILLGRSEP